MAEEVASSLCGTTSALKRSPATASPSLANLVAIMSREGVEAVADRILEALRPTGSTLLFAYTELAELGASTGWHPPLMTDDWWLDAVEASTPTGVEGTFQDAMGWGHWGFHCRRSTTTHASGDTVSLAPPPPR